MRRQQLQLLEGRHLEWMMRELKRRGQQNVRRESCEAILRCFPDRDEAVVAWVTIASGEPYVGRST